MTLNDVCDDIDKVTDHFGWTGAIAAAQVQAAADIVFRFYALREGEVPKVDVAGCALCQDITKFLAQR